MVERGRGYVSGDVAWAKLQGLPWWPCVVFETWDELIKWDLPHKVEDKPLVEAHQVVCCFLHTYNLQVFEKGTAAIRGWEDSEFKEAINCVRRASPGCRTSDHDSRAPASRFASRRLDGRRRKRRRQAIRDAMELVMLARGEIDDVHQDEEAKKRQMPSESSQEPPAKRARTRSSTAAAAVEDALAAAPKDWLEALRLLRGMTAANGREIKHVVDTAARLAREAGASARVLGRLSQCVSDPLFRTEDAGLCRIMGLRILEDYTSASSAEDAAEASHVSVDETAPAPAPTPARDEEQPRYPQRDAPEPQLLREDPPQQQQQEEEEAEDPASEAPAASIVLHEEEPAQLPSSQPPRVISTPDAPVERPTPLALVEPPRPPQPTQMIVTRDAVVQPLPVDRQTPAARVQVPSPPRPTRVIVALEVPIEQPSHDVGVVLPRHDVLLAPQPAPAIVGEDAAPPPPSREKGLVAATSEYDDERTTEKLLSLEPSRRDGDDAPVVAAPPSHEDVAEAPSRPQSPVAFAGRRHPDGRRLASGSDGAPTTLAWLVADGVVTPGELLLEQPDGTIIRAEVLGDGKLMWREMEFADVEQFVAAAREANGLRAPRATQARRVWERIKHVPSGRPLSSFLPKPAEESPTQQQQQHSSPGAQSSSATHSRDAHHRKQDATTTTTTTTKRERERSSRKRSRSNRKDEDSRKRKEEHARPHVKATISVSRLAFSDPPAFLATHPQATDAASAADATRKETPLSEYWTSKVSSTESAASVWDDGYFTDDSGDEEVKTSNNETTTQDDEDVVRALAEDLGQQHQQQQQRASRRPKRGRRDALLRMRGIVDGLAQNRLDPHALVSCEPYDDATRYSPANNGGETTTTTTTTRAGSSSSSSSSQQPFSLVVHPDAAFLCDLHAHLAEAEIIGLLGGRWDAARRAMHVQAPFPCRATPRDDDGATDVEMDPTSELQVREIIRSHGMEVVGWYHSHPKFAAEPSVTDIDNQRSYQGLFHDDRSGLQPFIGLIVGTYDSASPSPSSIFRYFHVAPPPDAYAKEGAAASQWTTAESDDNHEGLRDTGGGELPGFDSQAGRPRTDSVATDEYPEENDEDRRQQRSSRSGRRHSRREEGGGGSTSSSNRRQGPPPPMIPMSLRAKVRSYRRHLDAAERQERRLNGPPEPPVPRQSEAPFNFAKLCGFGCLCCPPNKGRRADLGGDRAAAAAAKQPVTAAQVISAANLAAATQVAPPWQLPAIIPDGAQPGGYYGPGGGGLAAEALPPVFVGGDPRVVAAAFAHQGAGDFPLNPQGGDRIFSEHSEQSEQSGGKSDEERRRRQRPGRGEAVVDSNSNSNSNSNDAAKKTREEVIDAICGAVKERVDRARRQAAPDDAGAAWARLEERYGRSKLSCVAHTVRQLGRYYGRHERRVDLATQWRKDLAKWEKLLHSLAPWTLKMAVEPDDRIDFLSDVFVYMHACWRTKPKRKRPPQPSRRRS
ncbi:hypothetical protein CTAYLR_006797 [Chrysophaeum taylorii]|uniref:Myb-like, SWIRM and MPN domain-containing protein 1 n=1 Tax=Chrysophaeum taylorii TaxID=2483200 RepID=A0AAD7XH89_9STRA|nr:hypothetical protein CTAYLR_006797 [Chrysophaeum taylorii]